MLRHRPTVDDYPNDGLEYPDHRFGGVAITQGSCCRARRAGPEQKLPMDRFRASAMSLVRGNGPVGYRQVVTRAALAPFIVDDIPSDRQRVHLTAGPMLVRKRCFQATALSLGAVM
jgi:hypothetical protein